MFDRIASTGKTDSSELTAAKAALPAYWTAAGSAKRSDDLTPYFSTARNQKYQRQRTRNATGMESMFTQMFIPAHSGKLEIIEMRFLEDSALTNIKSHVGSGQQTHNLKCGVLLRKQGGGWKIGAEDC